MKRAGNVIEQRLLGRVLFLKKLTVQQDSEGQKVEANGININIKGIEFYSKKFFQKGSRITIQFCLNNEVNAKPVLIDAEVIWSKIEQNGAVTGAQFSCVIKYDNYPKLYKLIYEQGI